MVDLFFLNRRVWPRHLAVGLMLATGLPLAARADSLPALSKLAQQGAAVSALVTDLDSGDTLAHIDPDTRLTPASLTKLVTAAAALDHWQADRMFTTRLLVNRPIDNGRVRGDLILQGAGDASLDDSDLWTLAAQLKSAGVHSVDGSLLVVESPFGPVGCETQDRCDALKRSDTAYNAPLSSIGVDFGTWCVMVRPEAVGTSARVGACAAAQMPIPVNGDIKTVAANRSPSYWVERITDDDGDSLRVGGEIPAGQPVEVYRAMSNPARGTGLLLAEILRESGIHISGKVELAAGPATDKAYSLASAQGLSLREQLDRMLRYSNNYIADVLTLDLAADTSPTQLTQLARAGQALSSFVSYTNSRRSHVKPPLLISGSGLTPENELSAQDFVTLLDYMYHDTRNFPAFYGGLVVPRQSPFAFLRGGSPAWLDRVALKTGTMNDPHSVFGIAGYMRKKDGGWMAFAIIVNGSGHHKHVPLYKSLAAARSDIESILAHN